VTLLSAIPEEIPCSGTSGRCGGRWRRGGDECERYFVVRDGGRGSIGQGRRVCILGHGGVFTFFLTRSVDFLGSRAGKLRTRAVTPIF
jgi:hypothetical protein